MKNAENAAEERLEDIFYGIDWQGFAPGVLGQVEKTKEVVPKPQLRPEPKSSGTSFDPFFE